jgi:hypothetical protein
MSLDAKIPQGPLAEKWSKHKFDLKLVNPANKRKYDIIIVGTGLAGASAAASLAELGYNVKAYCFRIARAAHTPLLHRVVSMPLKTTRTMATVFSVYFTIPLKVVTTAPANQTFTVWPRFR